MHIKKKRKRKHKWSIFCTLNYSLKWTRTINATIFQRLIVFAHDLWPQVQCWWLRLNLTSTLICIQTTKLIARLSVVCTKNFDLNWTKEGINDISQTDSDWWMTFDLIFFFLLNCWPDIGLLDYCYVHLYSLYTKDFTLWAANVQIYNKNEASLPKWLRTNPWFSVWNTCKCVCTPHVCSGQDKSWKPQDSPSRILLFRH